MIKSSILVLTTFFLFSNNILAQSFQLLDVNSSVISDTTHYENIDLNSPQQARFQVKNLTNSVKLFAVKVSLEYAPYTNSHLAIALAGNLYSANTNSFNNQTINNGIGDTVSANALYPDPNNLFTSLRFLPASWMWADCPNDSAVWRITIFDPANTIDSTSSRVIWRCVTSTSLEGAPNGFSFMVYPNPTTSLLIFNSKTNGQLYSVLGNKVFQFDEQSNIDISHLTTGIYFLKTNGTTIKIIKE
jgi:hypothetical protein